MRQKGEVVYIIPKASFKRRARLPTLYLVVFLKQARDINSATPSLHAEGHPSRVSAPPPSLNSISPPAGYLGRPWSSGNTRCPKLFRRERRTSAFTISRCEKNREIETEEATTAPYPPRIVPAIP